MTEPPAETRTVVLERVFPHPPEKLWRALTESPLLAQWLLPNDFAPVGGKAFQFRADPVPNWNGIIDCQVLVVDPFKQLSFTWGAMGMTSVVLFVLTPATSGTHLRMEHSGFASDQDAAYKGATYGWQKFLGNLERVVAEVD